MFLIYHKELMLLSNLRKRKCEMFAEWYQITALDFISIIKKEIDKKRRKLNFICFYS